MAPSTTRNKGKAKATASQTATADLEEHIPESQRAQEITSSDEEDHGGPAGQHTEIEDTQGGTSQTLGQPPDPQNRSGSLGATDDPLADDLLLSAPHRSADPNEPTRSGYGRNVGSTTHFSKHSRIPSHSTGPNQHPLGQPSVPSRARTSTPGNSDDSGIRHLQHKVVSDLAAAYNTNDQAQIEILEGRLTWIRSMLGFNPAPTPALPTYPSGANAFATPYRPQNEPDFFRELAELRRYKEAPTLKKNPNSQKILSWQLAIDNVLEQCGATNEHVPRTRWLVDRIEDETLRTAALLDINSGKLKTWKDLKTKIQNLTENPEIQRFDIAHTFWSCKQRQQDSFKDLINFASQKAAQMEDPPFTNPDGTTQEFQKITFFYSKLRDEIITELKRQNHFGKLTTWEEFERTIINIENALKTESRLSASRNRESNSQPPNSKRSRNRSISNSHSRNKRPNTNSGNQSHSSNSDLGSSQGQPNIKPKGDDKNKHQHWKNKGKDNNQSKKDQP